MSRRTPLSRPAAAVAGVTALVLTLAGCSGGAPAPSAAPVAVKAPASAVPAVQEPVQSAVPTPVASPSVEPSPIPGRASAAPSAPAAPSYDVAAVKRTLSSLKYYGGRVDGAAGPSLRSAVMAFQKVNGLGADGTVGPATLRALAAPRAPQLKGSAPANRVEVDLTKQVAYVVKGGAVARILPISSGNGATYEQKDGSTARALTPVGYYKVQRRIVGLRKADLGSLYDPQYFYKGWAIHGSNSVPAGPASHGCVRVTRPDAKYLLDAISVGTTVYLYGGKHVFTAGSRAPGTEAPTGDRAADTAAKPSPIREPAAPAPTRTASTAPTRPASPPPSKPQPASPPSAPAEPSASARPTEPAASPSSTPTASSA